MGLASQMFHQQRTPRTDHERQVLVLGMHRSGTSAVAGLLVQLGAFAGDRRDLMAATRDNPKGYFERNDVVKINERLLASTGAAWDHPLPFDPSTVPANRLQTFHRSALQITAALSGKSISIIKDPRMCLTLPLWRPHLTAPRIVLVWRNPLAVCRSLQERGMASCARGLALWEHYVLSSLRAGRGLPVHALRYEDLVEDPWSMVAALAAFCGLPSGNQAKAIAWIDPKLRRQDAPDDRIEQILSRAQCAVYRSLREPSTFSGGVAIPELSEPSRAELARRSSWSMRFAGTIVAAYRRRFRSAAPAAPPKARPGREALGSS